MRKTVEMPPRDVSKTLFMDMAFLLIAALVLLVQEPAKQAEKRAEQVKVPTVNLRVLSVQAEEVQVDMTLAGQTLGLEISQDGNLYEVAPGTGRHSLSFDGLAERVLTLKVPRVVVLRPDRAVPYEIVARVRDRLNVLQAKGVIERVIESVAHEEPRQ
jgi:biopolymer transport protein ExbD